MVFKRRDRQTWTTRLRESVWPRGGWGRGLQYMRYRLNRLPDRPERIARGIFAGVFISFTPLFGLHLGLCIVIAWAMRGNILAAIIGSFFGNPVTIPIIAVGSVELGRRLLGLAARPVGNEHIAATFAHAFDDLRHNVLALFTQDTTKWDGLRNFWDTIFLPYLTGGVILGTIAGVICYGIALSLVRAYQTRRQAKLRKRLEKIRARIAAQTPVTGSQN
ncbi:DUF2062 domain-containing protein [Paenirhodobacter populi]|uniref:DUF2062 domain-containing protein n=1 Tax=Paenirhodobacter populi TaxID=2306993 RepID=A0A443JHE0_9RHOB|nr:DUF2062 domain-containing protein [Sinirhodobacter populi]RWR19854.1 DUF2062 domain-containing protein [Sinirhodobacter populi]